MNEKKYGAITSPVDPDAIATDVTGVALFVAGILLTSGVIGAADYTTLLNAIPTFINDAVLVCTTLIAMWGLFKTLEGVIVRAYVHVFTKKATSPVVVATPTGTIE